MKRDQLLMRSGKEDGNDDDEKDEDGEETEALFSFYALIFIPFLLHFFLSLSLTLRRPSHSCGSLSSFHFLSLPHESPVIIIYIIMNFILLL